jgi:hypothetical protein
MRKLLELIGKLAISSVAMGIIFFFWPSIAMILALCGKRSPSAPKMSIEEEIGAVIIIFLSSFLWWLALGCAIIVLVNGSFHA